MLGTISKVAEKKNISLNVEVPEELFIEADEDKLRQIFMNLFSNAINYTHEGGNVKVYVKSLLKPDGSENVQFTVSDTGMGIPKKICRVFLNVFTVWIRQDPEAPVERDWGCLL